MLLLDAVNISQDGDRTPASCTELVLCACNAVHQDLLQPLSGCTEYVADENRTLRCRVTPLLTITRSMSGAA